MDDKPKNIKIIGIISVSQFVITNFIYNLGISDILSTFSIQIQKKMTNNNANKNPTLINIVSNKNSILLYHAKSDKKGKCAKK